MVSKHTSTLKRCFDLAAAATGLVAGSPVILATAAAMAVATRSFPLFRQERVGKDGKPFIILKIKTMNDKCDADGNLLPEDQRTSTLGVIVRKTHFDEIPQLLNILRGDMSVVGPRPFCDKRLDREGRAALLRQAGPDGTCPDFRQQQPDDRGSPRMRSAIRGTNGESARAENCPAGPENRGGNAPVDRQPSQSPPLSPCKIS